MKGIQIDAKDIVNDSEISERYTLLDEGGVRALQRAYIDSNPDRIWNKADYWEYDVLNVEYKYGHNTFKKIIRIVKDSGEYSVRFITEKDGPYNISDGLIWNAHDCLFDSDVFCECFFDFNGNASLDVDGFSFTDKYLLINTRLGLNFNIPLGTYVQKWIANEKGIDPNQTTLEEAWARGVGKSDNRCGNCTRDSKTDGEFDLEE